MLIRIICAIALIIACNLFLGCDRLDRTPKECPTPTEFGLIDVNTTNFASLAYGWTDMPDAQEYIFTLRVNGEIVHTETLVDNQVEFSIDPPLQDGDELTATVQAVCGDDTLSDTNKDVLRFRGGIAAVETVYKTGDACDLTCDYVKFDPINNQFCGYDIPPYLMGCYYPEDAFCTCVNGNNDCSTFSISAFIKCLSDIDDKQAGDSSGC